MGGAQGVDVGLRVLGRGVGRSVPLARLQCVTILMLAFKLVLTKLQDHTS